MYKYILFHLDTDERDPGLGSEDARDVDIVQPQEVRLQHAGLHQPPHSLNQDIISVYL